MVCHFCSIPPASAPYSAVRFRHHLVSACTRVLFVHLPPQLIKHFPITASLFLFLAWFQGKWLEDNFVAWHWCIDYLLFLWMAVKWKLTHTAHSTHTSISCSSKDRRLTMLIKSDLCMQYTHKYLSNRKTQKNTNREQRGQWYFFSLGFVTVRAHGIGGMTAISKCG